MRIGFLPANVDGAGCYRMIFPMAYLGARGHQAAMPGFILKDGNGQTVQPYPGQGLLERIPPGDFGMSYIDGTLPESDVYVLQLGSFDWMVQVAQDLKARGAKIVLDLDDDLHRSPAYNPAILDPGQSPHNNRRNTIRVLELADAATFATESLADFYSRWCADTTVLPNRLHWPMWEQLEAVYERKDWRRIRVGYMGNADYHRADLETIAAPFRKWLQRNPDVEFVAAGDSRIHDIIGTPDAQRVTTSKVWFRNLDLPHITSTFDIGLVPLVRNDFNEGKSYLKGLEYAACGIPTLASPTEPYRDFITDGETGFLCKYPRDFTVALDRLVGDADLRERMGRAARDNARACSLDRHIQDWEAVYARVAGDSDHADSPVPEGVAA